MGGRHSTPINREQVPTGVTSTKGSVPNFDTFLPGAEIRQENKMNDRIIYCPSASDHVKDFVSRSGPPKSLWCHAFGAFSTVRTEKN
jgi:hypothetical protein